MVKVAKEMIKSVYQKFFKNFNVTIKFSALLSVILIIIYLFLALILTYMPTIFSDFLGLILLLLILYLLVSYLSPYFYSFFANNMALETKDSSQVNIMSFIGTRRIGKRRGIKNIQQLFKWLLFSYLIYVVLELVIVVLIITIGQFVDNSEIQMFLKEFNSVNTMLGNEAYYEQISQILFKYEDLINLIAGISNFIAVSFAFYFFLYKFARSFINYYAMQGDGSFPIASFFLNKSIKRTLAIKEFDYNKKFFLIMWPYYLSCFVIFSITYLLMFFFLDTSVILNALTAMIVTVFLLLPFIPVVLDFNMLMAEKFRYYYLKVSSEDLTKFVGEEVVHHKFASKEEEEKFKKEFEIFNKKVQDMLNEGKVDVDKESKNNNLEGDEASKENKKTDEKENKNQNIDKKDDDKEDK